MAAINTSGSVGGEVHGGAGATATTIIVIAIVAFFFLFEGKNIATWLANAMNAYSSVRAPVSQTPQPSAQTVAAAAGNLNNSTVAASTSNLPNSSTITPSVG